MSRRGARGRARSPSHATRCPCWSACRPPGLGWVSSLRASRRTSGPWASAFASMHQGPVRVRVATVHARSRPRILCCAYVPREQNRHPHNKTEHVPIPLSDPVVVEGSNAERRLAERATLRGHSSTNTLARPLPVQTFYFREIAWATHRDAPLTSCRSSATEPK
ncbi:hypothetical protein BD413DRAFT_81817 [Trametes elegans]|nr:hypothetical protein BD413DRAFT_81817 [Trametes elegans]